MLPTFRDQKWLNAGFKIALPDFITEYKNIVKKNNKRGQQKKNYRYLRYLFSI